MRSRELKKAAWLALATALFAASPARADDPKLDAIETIVVIYAENRSFDNLYGLFPGANGLQNVTAEAARQVDRDGGVLAELPPIWHGLTAPGVKPAIGEAQTAHLPNAPFAIDDPQRFNLSLAVATHDLVAPLLPEPDADRWRQERPLCRLGRFRRPGHGPL